MIGPVRQAELALEVEAIRLLTERSGMGLVPWQCEFLWNWKIAEAARAAGGQQ